MDKRFWSGAVIVLTVVVAGASALPGLLLRPAADETPVEPVPSMARPAVPQPVKPAEAERPAAEAVLPVVAEVRLAPTPSQPVAEAPAVQPQPAPAQATPLPPLPQPAPQPVAEAPRRASPFPPVQPVGVDAPAAIAQTPPTQTRDASATRQVTEPASEARSQREKAAPRTARQDGAKRKPQVRPAIYPLREFLAWRR